MGSRAGSKAGSVIGPRGIINDLVNIYNNYGTNLKIKFLFFFKV